MSTAMRRDGFEYMDFDDFEELLADKPAHERWELIGGRVVRMMVGARWEHKRIVQNITSALLAEFRRRGSDCRPFDETFFMKIGDLNSALLPDVMVRCGPLPKGATSLADPVVIFEVLSDSTLARDRSDKWTIYQRVDSLMHYVLVDRSHPAVEVYSRIGGAWTDRRVVKGRTAAVELPAVGVVLPLAVMYEDLALDDADGP